MSWLCALFFQGVIKLYGDRSFPQWTSLPASGEVVQPPSLELLDVPLLHRKSWERMRFPWGCFFFLPSIWVGVPSLESFFLKMVEWNHNKHLFQKAVDERSVHKTRMKGEGESLLVLRVGSLLRGWVYPLRLPMAGAPECCYAGPNLLQPPKQTINLICDVYSRWTFMKEYKLLLFSQIILFTNY